jgi:hypothetical protein
MDGMMVVPEARVEVHPICMERRRQYGMFHYYLTNMDLIGAGMSAGMIVVLVIEKMSALVFQIEIQAEILDTEIAMIVVIVVLILALDRGTQMLVTLEVAPPLLAGTTGGVDLTVLEVAAEEDQVAVILQEDLGEAIPREVLDRGRNMGVDHTVVVHIPHVVHHRNTE